MVSYRIATVLKLPDEHAVRKGMLELFNLDMEHHMENGVNEFCEAVAVCMTFSDFLDLDQRVTLLQSVFETLQEALPSSEKQIQGTAAGNALVTFPIGRKIIDEAKLHLTKGVQTIQARKEFTSLLDRVLIRCTNAAALDDLKGVGDELVEVVRDLGGAACERERAHTRAGARTHAHLTVSL